MFTDTLEGYPLSLQQKRLWHFQADQTPFRTAAAILINTSLNLEKLRQALDQIVQRHEILRTVFRQLPGMKLPVQVVLDQPAIEFRFLDADPGMFQNQGELIEAIFQTEWLRKVDLEQGPVLQVAFLALQPGKSVLFVTIPALCADAQTMGNFINELETCYTTDITGSDLDPEPVQFVQFSEWQHSLLESDEAADGKAFWNKIDRTSLTVRVPFELPATLPFEVESLKIPMSSRLRRELRSLAEDHAVAFQDVLLTAWQIFLTRMTGTKLVTVGVMDDGRTVDGLTDTFGLLARPVPVYSELIETTSFASTIKHTLDALSETTEWQEYFDFEALFPAPSQARIHFQFEFLDFRPETPTTIEQFTLYRLRSIPDPFHLKLVGIHYPDNFSLEIQFDRAQIEHRYAAHLARCFETLLASLVQTPETEVGKLNLLSDEDRQFLLVQLNQTAREYPTIRCLHELFENQVRRIPDEPALVFQDANQSDNENEFNDFDEFDDFDDFGEEDETASHLQILTFREVNARADRLARHLQSFGIGPEMLVGICSTHRPETIIGMLGILKAGAAFVPLDPTYPKERLAFLLSDSNVHVLLTETRFKDRLPDFDGTLVYLDEPFNPQRRILQPSGVTPENLAYVIYTSGSTGQPKGVMIEHRSVVNYLHWCLENYPTNFPHGAPLHSPIGFDLTITSLFAPLLAGRSVWITTEDVGVSALATALTDAKGFGFVKLTPTHLEMLNQELANAPISKKVGALIIGGEALSGETLTFWQTHSPTTRLINEYGPTEATVGCCVYEVPPGQTISGPVPIGKPIANMQMFVLDAQGEPVPFGVPGEIFIGGIGLARGYVGDRVQGLGFRVQGSGSESGDSSKPVISAFINSSALSPQPPAPGPTSSTLSLRLYKTGDLGRIRPDGTIEFLGRIDDQVKIRGYRIEPGEIESVLRKHAAVRDAVVIAREDTPGNKRLVAYVIAQEAVRADFDLVRTGLQHFLAEHLPEHMLPTALVFLSDFPVSPNGKIDRRALPAPERIETANQAAFATPETVTQQALAEVWAQLLGVKQVGVNDNFFSLGGHSLLGTQLMSRIRKVFGVEISLRKLFEFPTLAGLAELIDQTQATTDPATLLQPELPPIERVSRDLPLPLSFAQHRLWFLDQLEPGSAAYNVPAAIRLQRPLNSTALEQAFSELLHRHEVLRTVYHSVNGTPVQTVLASASGFELRKTEVSAEFSTLSESHQKAQLTQQLAAEASQPFDLATGPLVRALLVKLAENDHIFMVTMHHIVCDGWSIQILVRELITLYLAFSEHKPSPLVPLPVQYADFAHWQQEWFTGEVMQRQIDYWKTQLADCSPLQLPTDFPRPPIQTHRGSKTTFHFSPELSEKLRTLSQSEGVTLFMTLLAGFQTLLYRYSGQDEICVGSPTAGRSRIELEPLVGFFVNTLVLRTSFATPDGQSSLSFRDIVQRVKDTALDAFANQDVPFEQIVEAVQPERDLSRSPLFQVMFDLQPARTFERSLKESGISPIETSSQTAKFDLTLGMIDSGDTIQGQFEYNTDLFRAETIERIVAHFNRLLETIVTDPGQPVGALSFLTESEQAQLDQWVGTTETFPLDQCIHQLFVAQVQQTPEAIALVQVAEDDPTQIEATVTYQELNTRADALASRLQALGIQPDTLVGLCLEPSIEMIVGMLGILKSGGAYVPLDPIYPGERLAFMIEDAGLSVVVTDTRSGQVLSVADQITRLNLNDLKNIRDTKDINSEPGFGTLSPQPSALSPTALAYAIYTSGSTGTPKGVLIEHRSLVNLACAAARAFELTSDDAVVQFASISFDTAAEEIFPALISGARVIVKRNIRRLSFVDFHRVCNTAGVTIFDPPTAYWHEWTRELTRTNTALPETLRLVVVGGERALPEVFADWQTLAGNKVRWINTYGPTEATVSATLYEPAADPNFETNRARLPIGRPLPNVQALVLDRHQQPVPPGFPGELNLGGVGIARGYLGFRAGKTGFRVPGSGFREPGSESSDQVTYQHSETSAQNFKETLRFQHVEPGTRNPEPGTRFSTGDLVRWLPDGNLEFLGRVDSQVKIRGFRVEPGEVENTLNRHQLVAESVVMVREDEHGNKHLVAYVTAKPEAESATLSQTLSEYLETTVPAFMVPSAMMVLEAFPLTPNGKIDRKRLPQFDLTGVSSDAVTPLSTPTEELLAGLYAQVLKLQTVGGNSHFFALGGHSLTATQLISRVRDTFAVEVPLRQLFEFPTLSGFAAVIDAARLRQVSSGEQVSEVPLARTSREHTLPLSFAQERLWFLHEFEPTSTAYNLPAAFRITGPLNITALEQALIELTSRHEVLRTTFHTIDGKPAQKIHLRIAENFITKKRILGNAEYQKSKVTAEFVAEARAPFDLSRGPLLRVKVFQLGENDHVLMVTLHHIISDGWSSSILVRELAALYRAFSNELPSPLSELPVQYADFAAWQRAWLQGERLERQIAYWRAQLSDVPPVIELPTDRPRPAVQSFKGGNVAFSLPADLSEQLKTISQQEGVTLYMTLLAAFQALLHRYSQQETVVVGTPIAGRTRKELEPLIGFFVNTLVMRADFSPTVTFRQLLRQVRETALTAYAHQDVPFEKLVEALHPVRDLSYTPIFQVMFVLQNVPQEVQLSTELGITPIGQADGAQFGGPVKFDLTLGLRDTGRELIGNIEYNATLFDESTIRRMLDHFRNLLSTSTHHLEQPIASLPILTEAEQSLLLSGNPDFQVFPVIECLHHRFEAQVKRTPEAVAVVFGEAQLTYRELNERADTLALHLNQQGVGPETLVALCVERSLEMVVGILGILKSGAAYVPIDPTYPQERIAFILDDAQSPVVVTQSHLTERITSGRSTTSPKPDDGAAPLPQPSPNVIRLDKLVPVSHTLNPEPRTLNPAFHTRNPAYVIYTSGSTGKPKGVVVTHANAVRLFDATNHWFNFDQNDVWTLFHSVAFDFSVWEVWGALLYGGKLVVVDYWTSRSAEDFYKLLQREQVTVLNQTPSAFRQLMRVDQTELAELALRYVIFGGEKLEPGTLLDWFERHGDAHPRLINMYGITETTVHVTFHPLTKADAECGQTSPIGVPIPDLQVFVLDRHGLPVPIGVKGELYVGGAGVARGYLNRPELTAERFKAGFRVQGSGFESGFRASESEGYDQTQSKESQDLSDLSKESPQTLNPEPRTLALYRTGDLGRWLPNGRLEYLGRIDDQVKIRGFRIEPGEIQAVLNQQPEVAESLLLVKDEAQGGQRLVAYVVPKGELDGQMLIHELQTRLKAVLPEYMVPSAFVVLTMFPLTAHGKIDRRQLPDPEHFALPTSEQIGPRTATEAALVELWAELLGLNSLSVTDNFFDLGGHSLLAAQLVSRIRDSFQVELPLRRLFEIPVLQDMAAEIQAALMAGEPGEAMLSALPPIVPVSREQQFPLSFAQERLWFLHQLDPHTSAYNIPFALRLTGALDQSALERAFLELIHRHEVLRTGYLISDGQPIQDIQDGTLTFHIWNQDLSTDLVALDEPARKRRIGHILVTEAQKPFDLTHPPMLRVGVLKLAENDHILALTLHHIAADGWSMGILVRELGTLYRAYSKGLSPLLPPLPVQYADFAHWQRGWLQGTVLETQVAYWKEKLQDAPPALELPTDRPRPAMQTFNGATRGFALSAEVTQSLHALSRREGVTLFMTLLAAYKVFLARYSGQADICVGTTTANRNRKEIEGLIGYFLNTLVLRTRLESDSSTHWTTFRELLGRVRETTLGAFSHQDVPFEKLVEVLHPKRELSHSPLFQVAFVLQNTPLQTVPLGDIQVQLLSGTDKTAKYDLLLSVIETADGLKCGMEYNTDLFDASTIDRMISHFRTLVENLLVSPDESVSLVPMMSPAEAHQILVDWNDTAVELAEPLLVHRRFEQQVAQTPEVTAVEFINPQSRERTALSYRELNQQAERLAAHLQILGVGPDVIVGLCLERSVEMVVGMLGILKAGGAFLPMDPTYPADRLAFMVADAGLSVIVTNTRSSQWVPTTSHITTIDLIDLKDIKDLRNIKDTNSEPRTLNPEPDSETIPHPLSPIPQSLAYVIYTSGSTGKPKGTLLTHHGLCNLSVAQQRAFQVTPDDRVLQFASLSFDAAVWEVAMALLSGSTLVVTTRETVTSPEQLVRFLQTESITIATLPPTMLSAMPTTNLPALRLLVVAGERCPVEVANQWSPGRRFVNAYGPTETTVCASMFECHGTLTQPPPIGRPIANTQLFIVDPWGNPVPAGIPGELYIGGTSLARGYLNRPENTGFGADETGFRVQGSGFRVSESKGSDQSHSKEAQDLSNLSKGSLQTLNPEPRTLILEPRTLYCTGDRVRWLADGNVEFLGRLDDQVKVRGHRIELGEIETILQQHPDVQAAAVRVLKTGQPDAFLVAYVTIRPDSDIVPTGVETELRAYLKGQVPAFMVPSVFIHLDQMPLTPSGKIDRNRLPAPESAGSPETDQGIAPRTATETLVAELFAELLFQPKIGIHHNFFELGGHSLLATRLATRVREAFAIEFPLQQVFSHPTVAELAGAIDLERAQTQVRASAPPVQPVSRNQKLPLSFTQQRLWFLDQLEPGSAAYIMPAALRLTGELDLEALRNAFSELVKRHEILRTTFVTTDGEPTLHIAESAGFTFAIEDASNRSIDLADTQSATVQQFKTEILQFLWRPFDLAAGPLLRVQVVKLAETDHLLLISMHHIVSDGWSIGVMLREVAALYRAGVTGQPSSLPALPVQFADYAAWQRDFLNPERLEEELACWKQKFAAPLPVLSLPTDRPRPEVQTFQGSDETFSLSPELSEKVRALSRQHGSTLFMTLLAAFQTLLSRYTGQEDIVVGSPIANRNHLETEGLIGPLINTLALRTDFSGQPTFLDVLNRVRQTTLEAFAHSEVPFEKIVDAVQPERDMSRTPLFQVMFDFGNQARNRQKGQTLPGLSITPVEFESRIARLDLTLSMVDTGDSLAGNLEFNTDLFDRVTIQRMLGHFQTLLENLVANPEQPVTTAQLMTEAELHQILVEWNDTHLEYPKDKCLHQLFEAQAVRAPLATAVVFGDAELTYGELNARADALAGYLCSLGVGPDTLVGICVERSLEMVVGLLGILKAGGAYVPLDPTYPLERLIFMIQDAQLPVIVTDTESEAFLPVHQSQVVNISTFEPSVLPTPRPSPPTPDSLAYVIYTSGSTGLPKGVLITHRNIVNLCSAVQHLLKLSPSDRFLQFASLNFDTAAEEIFSALTCGATVVLRTHTVVPSCAEFVEFIDRHRVTVIDPPTAYFSELTRELTASNTPLPASLRMAFVGGEKASPVTSAQWQKLGQGRASWINGYGPTEATVTCIAYAPPAWSPEMETWTELPIGRPMANVQAYILDRNLQPVPIGVPGELCIGGDGVARGYLNRPELTAERFALEAKGWGLGAGGFQSLMISSPQPLAPSPCLYKTGDLARFRPDGIIEYLGRIDDQVKIRGYRVELGEIEAVLMQHPQVAEAVVLAKPDESGHKRLIAFVKLNPELSQPSALEPGTRNPEPGTLALAVFLGDQLPEYMIPVAFVVLEQFPMLPNGKVDRKALLRVPVAIEAPAKEVTLPQTQIEETLARIWAQVLRVPQVGIHDNFFELGGDSILTIQIVARAGQAGLKLSPKDIFQRQTIAELATIVEAGALISNEQGLVSGTVPLTPIQHWFFEQPLSNPHHWNQAFLFEVPLALETEKLNLAVKHVLDHHDAVRMRFNKTETGYVQTNLSAEPGEVVRFHDLSDVPDEGLASEIEQLAQAEQASLHISEGPLVRVTYLATGLGRTNRLLVVIHHLVIDAVSWRILLEDLIAAYRQLSQNQPVQLPAKTTSFKDWAERLHIYAQSPALTQEAPFWLNMIKPPVARIPVDFIKGENTVASAAEVVGTLDEAQTTALLRQVPKAFGTQINEVLLTAVTRALSDWILETLPTSTTFNQVTDLPSATRNPTLLIDFEGHGREELFPDVNLSRTIGWFTTLFPVRLELSTTQPVTEHLKTIQHRLQQIPNRGIGYGVLRYLNQDHSLQAQFSAAAHAEIAFNYFGQLDAHPGTATGVPGFRVAPESPGSPADAQGIRSHLIEVQASITGGKLKIVWTYSQNLHSPVIISRLSHLCLDTLTTLISQTQLAAQSRMVQPEDFPLANLDKNKLGKVLSQLGKKK